MILDNFMAECAPRPGDTACDTGSPSSEFARGAETASAQSAKRQRNAKRSTEEAGVEYLRAKKGILVQEALGRDGDGFVAQLLRYAHLRLPTLHEYCTICDQPHML